MSKNADDHDADELIERFKDELDVADWSMLKPHYERGALVIVSSALDLINVAVAVVKDDSDLVTEWLRQKNLRKPTDQEAQEWGRQAKGDEKKSLAEILVVQPYVLVQLIPGQLS